VTVGPEGEASRPSACYAADCLPLPSCTEGCVGRVRGCGPTQEGWLLRGGWLACCWLAAQSGAADSRRQGEWRQAAAVGVQCSSSKSHTSNMECGTVSLQRHLGSGDGMVGAVGCPHSPGGGTYWGAGKQSSLLHSARCCGSPREVHSGCPGSESHGQSAAAAVKRWMACFESAACAACAPMSTLASTSQHGTQVPLAWDAARQKRWLWL
jgi:hypothetical protein